MITLPAEHAQRAPQGQIHFYRPSAAGLDRRINLELNRDGTQIINTKEFQPGLWKVRVSWSVENQDYFIERQLTNSATIPAA
jgi:nitrogen fixation protein FixH